MTLFDVALWYKVYCTILLLYILNTIYMYYVIYYAVLHSAMLYYVMSYGILCYCSILNCGTSVQRGIVQKGTG